MTNIPRYTEHDVTGVRAPVRAASRPWVAEAAYVAFLLLVFVTLSPFAIRHEVAVGAASSGAGDLGRQLSYVAVLAVIMGTAWHRRGWALLRAVPLSLVLLLAWCVVSALWAGQPDVTFRRAILAAIIVISVFLSVDTIGAERALRLLCIVLVGILIVNWLAMPFVPQAVHLPDDFEPSIVGNWRGLFYHKNLAGSVCATTAILFLFSGLSDKRMRDYIIVAAALAFLVMTGSKTSLGLLPASLLLGWLYQISARNGFNRHLLLVAVVFIAVVVAGVVAVEFDTIVGLLNDPQQFTGRTAIWQAEIAYIFDHPLLGSGFGSFADTGARSPLYPYMAAATVWLNQVAQGHNGYLELLVTIGITGFVIAMIGLVIRPLLTFWYDKRLDPVFKMLLFTLFSFGVLHNMMESDFLASDGPQWVTFLLTIALLYTARRESAPPPRQIAEP